MFLADAVAVEAAKKLTKTIRVLIADDHRLFAQALEAILDTDNRIEVAGHARDGREAAELARSLKPDVILMDIAMPVMDGFQATSQILKEAPGTCVLMLTGSNSRTDVDRARKSGAAGYVTKDRIAAELIDAIIEVVGR
jgi:DNA-binding NarL/FixJ family response regulator